MRTGRRPSKGSKDAANQQRLSGPDLSLQGQHVGSTSGSDLYGLGGHGGISAYDLYYQSSGESSASFLPPVPSLPGISAPANSLGKSQQLQLHKTSSSAGSSVSPVKLRAWQNARTAAQQQAGAIPSYTLPKAYDSSKAAGVSGSPTTQPSSCSHSLPAIQSPSAPKSIQGRSEQSARSAGSPTAAASARAAGSAGAGLAGTAKQQLPTGSMFDSTPHLTTIVLPPDVVTGQDAIRYFGSGAGTPSDIIYCNLAVPCIPCFSGNVQQEAASGGSSLTAGGRTGGIDSNRRDDDAIYNPYELRAVKQQDANKQQHFIVSYNGVIHMRAGEPPDLTPHAEWLRQAELFYVLSQLSFCKQHRARMAFSTWHRNILRQKFAGRSKQLESKLLVRHNGVSRCLQQVHMLLEAYLTAGGETSRHHPAAMLDSRGYLAAQHGADMHSEAVGATAASTAKAGPAVENPLAQRSGVQVPAALQSTDAAPPEVGATVLAANTSKASVAGGTLVEQGSVRATAAPAAAVQGAAVADEANTVIVQSCQICEDLVAARWSKSAATGKWQLVKQSNGANNSSNMLLQQPQELLQEANEVSATSRVLTKPGLLPDTAQMRSSVEASYGASAVQKQQLEDLSPAPIRVLPLLTAVVPTEGAVTTSDLAAWRARSQPAVATAMSQLHAQLLKCVQQLEQRGNARLRAEQASATAAEQEVKQAGRKAPLPWNEAIAYDLKRPQRDLAAILVRIARWIDIMATSYAAQLAAAATAHLVLAFVMPAQPEAALHLCHQQYKGLLGQLPAPGGEAAGLCQGVQLRTHVEVRDAEDLLSEQITVGHGAAVCAVRFVPDLDDLCSAVGSLPTQLTNMINSLPLLSNEPAVATWRELLSKPKKPRSPGHVGAIAASTGDVGGATIDANVSGDSGTPAGGTDVSGRRLDALRGRECNGRNVRLEVLLVTSEALNVQAALVNLVHQHFTATRDSLQLQPLREATPLYLLCSSFDPQRYLQLQTSARQLAADVTAVGTWLSHLTDSSAHCISSAHGAGSEECLSHSGSAGCKCWGIVVMDVAAARTAMCKLAGATLGSMLSILHSAFMRHCHNLHTQLDATIATLQQRPDTLEAFTTWLASIVGHLLPSVVAGIGTGRGLSLVMASQSGLQDQAKDRTTLMAEFEALRSLLDIMRPGSSNPVAGLISGTASMRPGSPGYDAREAAVVSLRQLGPAPIRAATSALSVLQARVVAYKDAARAAGGHAASGAKSLAHEMALHMTEAQGHLVELLKNLRCGDSSQSSCSAAVALQHIDKLRHLHEDLLQQQQRHLLAAELFKEKDVEQAVQAFRGLSDFLTDELSSVAAFRSAQMAWSVQLEALYRTSAISDDCKEQLHQLEHCGQQLMQHVQHVEMLKPGTDVCSATSATSDEAQLAAAVRLDLSAWQTRWPRGALLTDEAMHRKHMLLLLQLMTMAETAATPAGLLHSSLPELGLGVATAGSELQEGLAADFAYVCRVLQHYRLIRLDLYQSVYLSNAAVAAERLSSDDGDFSANGSNSNNPNNNRWADNRGLNGQGIFWRLQLAAGCSNANGAGIGEVAETEWSVAALLVWVTRSKPAAAVLHRVLQVAQAEQQLNIQVSAAYAHLSSLTLHLSSSRVAGCFMITNLYQLTETLQALQAHLRAVAVHECHVGVEAELMGAQLLQQRMLDTIKACDSAQTKLLALHNLYHHPALSSCLSAQHKVLYTAAVQAWAPAVLKVRSSSSSSKPRRSSYAEEGASTERAGVVQGYNLLRHMGALGAAAQLALAAIHKARTTVGPVITTELQNRWPRLALAPQESLLQLVEELPSCFRAAAAQQAIRLPIPLLDVLFRGVTCLLPARKDADVQVLTVSSPGKPASAASKQQQQQQVVRRLSTVSARNALHPPGSACSIIITGDQVATALQQVSTVSGYLHEPLSTAETAAAAIAGGMVISALCCCGRSEISRTSSAAAAAGSSTEVLLLNPSQQQQQETAPTVDPTASRRRAAAASRHQQQQQRHQGVVWGVDACPAAVLRAAHAAAAAALKHQTYQAIQAAGNIPTEEWAGSCCRQALLLADGVHWTRAVTSSLQQLAAGNSHALRALADSAVLQLENVTTALRRKRYNGYSKQGGEQGGVGSYGREREQQDGPEVLVVEDKQRDVHSQRGQQQQQQQLGGGRTSSGGVRSEGSEAVWRQQQQQCGDVRSSSGGGASCGRASTPDPAESSIEPRSSGMRASIISSSAASSSSSSAGAAAPAAVQLMSPCSKQSAAQQAAINSSKGLTREQLLGLQLLVTAGTCHREVAAALVAAGVQDSSDFEWGRQLRHYWQAEEEQLQVCFGPCQVTYGWEYCPAATSSLIQPLASGLLSGSSLLAAAAAAIDLPPVVGLEILGWQYKGGSSDRVSSPSAGVHKQQSAAAAATVGLQQHKREGSSASGYPLSAVSDLSTVVDVLGSVLGLQAVHFNCHPGTSSTDAQEWLAAVAAAAGAENAGGTLGGGVLGSISGLQKLSPSVLAAFSSTLCHMQQQRALIQSQGDTEVLGDSGFELHSLSLPDGQRLKLSRLAIFCEISHGEPAMHDRLSTDSTAAGSRSRSEVVGAVQQYGRCVALQAPGLALLIECVFRQLGLVDCAGAAALLALLLQQAADLAAPDQQQQQQQGERQKDGAAGQLVDYNYSDSYRYSFVSLGVVQQIQQHLVGLQQAGKPEMQPSTSAWGVLSITLEYCVLPRLSGADHDGLLQSMEAGLQAAVKSGRVSKPVAAAAAAAAAGSSTTQQQHNEARSTCYILPGVQRADSIIHSCRELDVQRAVLDLCKDISTCRTPGGSAAAAAAGNSSSSSSASQQTNHLPAMHSDAAALVCSKLHTALQLHGCCLIVGPTSVGKTLSWKTLKAAYRSIAAAAAAADESAAAAAAAVPVWVHCCPEVLLDAAGGAAQTAERLEELIISYHTSALETELMDQQGMTTHAAFTAAAAATTNAAAGAGGGSASLLTELQTRQPKMTAAAAAPPNILVLDVQQLEGPVLQLLTHLVQQRSRRALTAHHEDQLPLMWQLPGCIGVVVECCSTPDNSLAQQQQQQQQQQLLQQIPVVAVRPPGLLNAKQQLAQELWDAFKPLPVLPQSPHCVGLTQASIRYPAGGTDEQMLGVTNTGVSVDTSSVEQQIDRLNDSRSSRTCSDTGGVQSASAAAATSSSNPGLLPVQKAVPAGSCGAASEVNVSYNMLDSLAALLQDLVGAGLAVSSSSSSSNGEDWETSILARDCCRNAVAVAAAMWEQSTPCQAEDTCLIASSSSSSSRGGSNMVKSGQPFVDYHSSSSSSSWSHPSTTASPAEQFAAKILVFCAIWITAGHSDQHQIQNLGQTLSAVLSGAGFSWAEPPASLGGLFSARLDLSTGRWVAWLQDVFSLATMNRRGGNSSSDGGAAAEVEQVDLPYHVCNTGSRCYFWGSGDGSVAPGGSVFSPDAPGWRQYSGSSSGGGPMIDSSSSSSSSCGGWQPGCLFMASPRTCALQYLVYWFISAGMSPLLLAKSGSGVKAAVRQLITHTWPAAAAAAAAAAAGCQDRTQQQPQPYSSAESVTFLPLPVGLSVKQVGACVQQHITHCVAAVANGNAHTAAAAAAVVGSALRSSIASDRRVSYGANCEGGSSSNPDGSSTYRSSMDPINSRYSSAVAHTAGRSSSRRGPTSAAATGVDGSVDSSSAAATAANVALFDRPVVLFIEDFSDASSSSSGGSSSSSRWIKPLLESRCCTAVDNSSSSSHLAAVARAHVLALGVQQPQLLAICMEGGQVVADALCRDRSLQQMLPFNAECVCCLPDTCIPQANLSNVSVDWIRSRDLDVQGSVAAAADQIRSPVTAPCLINPREVLTMLFQHYSLHIPRVHAVTRPQLLQALKSVMWGVTTAMQHLQQQQLLPRHCCFDIRHYKQCIDTILGLCAEHLAQLDSDRRLGEQDVDADQASAAATVAAAMNPTTPGPNTTGLSSPWVGTINPQMTQTPHTPGMSLASGGLFHEGLLGGLGARRISLKALCCAVVDGLCRCVCDAAATAAEQQALQRLVLLLIAEHLAVIDQPPPGSSTSGSGGGSSSQGSILAQPVLIHQAAAAAARAGSRSAAAGGSTRSNWISETLDTLSAASSCARIPSPHSKETPAAWQQLQHMSDPAFSEAVRTALLPRTLSNRVLMQISHIAVFGRDPVLNLEGLHIAAAQQELQQLLLQQAAAPAAVVNASPVVRLGMKLDLPTSGSSSSGSSSSSSEGVVADLMSVADLNWSQKLLPCSAFVAAAHKLMWWMQQCTHQQQQEIADPADPTAYSTAYTTAYTTLSLEISKSCFATADLMGARLPSAAAAANRSASVHCAAVLQPSNGGSAASVATLAGDFMPAIHAAAAAAAAAVGSPVLWVQGNAAANADQRIIEAMQIVAAAALAGSAQEPAAAGARRSSTSTWASEGSAAAAAAAEGSAAAAAARQSSTSLSASAYRVSQLSSGPSVAQGEETAVAAADPPLQQQQQLVIVIDLHACDAVDDNLIQLMQRWSARQPGSYNGLVNAMLQQQGITNASGQQQQQQQQQIALGEWALLSRAQQQQQQHTSPTGIASSSWPADTCRISIAFILLCSPSQQQLLLAAVPDLQQHCYNMSLPSTQVPEQLAADCRAQLIAHSSSALLEHVRDVHTLVTHQHHQQQQHGVTLDPGTSDPSNSAAAASAGDHAVAGSSKPVQQQQQAQISSASAAAAAAAVPTESTARRLADRLSAALADAHQSACEAYKQAYHAQHTSSSSSSGVGSDGSANFVAQAVPLSKPFDVLLLLPQLTSHFRQQLAARRNLLQSCLAKISKTQAVLEQQIVNEQQQQQHEVLMQGDPGLPDARPRSPTFGVFRSESGLVGSRLDVLLGLKSKLVGLAEKWNEELHKQVFVQLVQVLPSALLASLELIYLGALPRHTQQQLLPAWQHKIIEAVAGGNPAAAAAAAVGDLVDRPRFFAGSVDLGRSSNVSADIPRCQGRSLINLLKNNPAAATAPTDSEIASCLGLLQREGPLHQQIKLAAAAAALTAQCGMPLLVTDPWNLLPEVLVPNSRRDRIFAAAAAAGGGGGSSSGWELISAWNGGGVKNTQDGVDIDISTTPMYQLLHRVQAAFESGSNVCLQLQCNAATASETAAAVIALHTYVQLQAAAAAAAEDQDDLGSSDSISPGQAGTGSSSSSRAFDRSARSRKPMRVSSAYSTKSRSASAASSRGFAAGSAAAAAAAAVGEVLGPLSPRLVIQVVSNAFELPAELAGLCHIVDLGGWTDHTQVGVQIVDQHHPLQQQQQQQQLRSDLNGSSDPNTRQASSVSTGPSAETLPYNLPEFLPEYVMKVVIETAAADRVAAVAAAAGDAEAWQQQCGSDEAKLMRRLTQDFTPSPSTPILLESLASSVDQLAATAAEAACRTAAAATAAAELAAEWRPLASEIARCIHQLMLVCRGRGYETIPWEVLDGAVRRAVAAAIDESSSSSIRSSSSITADDVLSEQYSSAAAAASGDQVQQQQRIREAVSSAAVSLLQRLLVALLPPDIHHHLQQHWQQQQQQQQLLPRHFEPPEMLLCQVLAHLPAPVPVVVAAQRAADALAAVKAAGVAAGLSSSCFTVWRASQLTQTADSSSSSSRARLLQQCKSVLGADRSATRQQQQWQQQQVWLVVVVESTSNSVIQAAADCIQEARLLLLHSQQQQQQGRINSLRMQSGHSNRLRLWVAAPQQVASALYQATGGSSLLYRLDLGLSNFSIGLTDAPSATIATSSLPASRCSPAADVLMSAMLRAEAAVQQVAMLGLLPAGGSPGVGLEGRRDEGVTSLGSIFAREGPAGAAASSSSSSRVLWLLQPLMLAATRARCVWQMHLARSRSSSSSSRSGGSSSSSSSSELELVSAADLQGPWDFAHLYLVLHRIAAAVAAATEPTQRPSTSSSSSGKPTRSLKHLTHLPVDSKQLHKLLMWAIFGPSCNSEEARGIAQVVLQDCLNPSSLGVRAWDVGGRAGVQVLGNRIADTWEAIDKQLALHAAAEDQLGQWDSTTSPAVLSRESSTGGVAGQCSDENDDVGGDSAVRMAEQLKCLLPLGMALGRKQLWALLQSQQ